MRLPAAERELRHSPRIFHGGCAVCLNIGAELLKLWCAILGLKQIRNFGQCDCMSAAPKYVQSHFPRLWRGRLRAWAEPHRGRLLLGRHVGQCALLAWVTAPRTAALVTPRTAGAEGPDCRRREAATRERDRDIAVGSLHPGVMPRPHPEFYSAPGSLTPPAVVRIFLCGAKKSASRPANRT
jgi:hypothetical protein